MGFPKLTTLCIHKHTKRVIGVGASKVATMTPTGQRGESAAVIGALG